MSHLHSAFDQFSEFSHFDIKRASLSISAYYQVYAQHLINQRKLISKTYDIMPSFGVSNCDELLLLLICLGVCSAPHYESDWCSTPVASLRSTPMTSSVSMLFLKYLKHDDSQHVFCYNVSAYSYLVDSVNHNCLKRYTD